MPLVGRTPMLDPEGTLRQIRTIQDILVAHLRSDILGGRLKPGQRIIERAITDDWGISKTPVREALTHLEAEGWVAIIPHKGAVVAPLSVDELEDIYLIRGELEGLAARLAAERIDERTLETLGELVARIERLEPAAIDELMALNRQFHDELYRCSGRPLLCDLIGILQNKSLRYRRAFLDLTDARSRLLGQRHLLLGALRRRDPEAVERLVRDNLLHNCRLLAETMKATQGASAPAAPEGDTTAAPRARHPPRRKTGGRKPR